MTIEQLKIWQAGFNAGYYDKQSATDNPYFDPNADNVYGVSCDNGKIWFKGWYDAQYHPMVIKEYNKQNPHVRVR